jgi:FXSXX-COOH protein
MSTPERDQQTGLVDLSEVSLDDLPGLDDSVVANAIRRLRERRHDDTDYMETFDNYSSAP